MRLLPGGQAWAQQSTCELVVSRRGTLKYCGSVSQILLHFVAVPFYA